MAVAAPGCGITWPLLAAIGRVESNDGRFGGAQLLTTGYSTVKIFGPLLDGHGDAVIKAVGATSRSAHPGAAIAYARAMGPMQFIPSTWAEYASDGNGDGVESPFNIFDASLAAAKYLCVAGGDLRTPAGQRRAVFAYNHVMSYVVEVLSLEKTYLTGARIIAGGGAPSSGRHTSPGHGTTNKHHPSTPVASPEPTRSAPVSSPIPVKPPAPVNTPVPVRSPGPGASPTLGSSATPVGSPTPSGHGSPTR